MSKSQATPSKMKTRMGTLMRRSSTALSFAKPGTTPRTSTESLRLDSNAPSSEHAMPSPVAESPAREAAESMPEPTGPSKLSGAPITAPDPTPEPPPAVAAPKPEQSQVSSDVVENPLVPPISESTPSAEAGNAPAESAPAPAPTSDVVPVSLPESSSTALPGGSEPIAIASTDPARYVSGSPESVSRAESEHATEEPLPVGRSEDSDERQLPTEMLANPWDAGPLVAERSSQEALTTSGAPLSPPNPMSTDPALAPSTFGEAPAINVDKSSVAGITLKSRTRGSTISSQVRPRTPSIPNGRLSAKPSQSSLSSSAAAFSSHLGHVVSTEPRQEDVAALPATSRAYPYPLSDPVESARPTDAPGLVKQPSTSMFGPGKAGSDAGSRRAGAPIDVPLPPPSQVVYAMPIQTAPSNASVAGKNSVFSPREFVEYDTDESRPLLQPSTTSLKNYGQLDPGQSVSLFVPQDEGSLWPVSTRRFTSLGWQEYVLPDGARYFSNPDLHIVTDVDLRNAERLEAMTTLLSGSDAEVLPPKGWELWFRDTTGPTTAFIPAKAWVHHGARMVLLERPSSDPGEVMSKDVDKTDMEYQYWSFMVSHPAHAPLPTESVSEAIDVLTWSYTDRLVPSPALSLPPFSQGECQELIALLRSFEHVSPQIASVVRTRVVSKVLLRIAAWRQGHPMDGQDPRRNSSIRVPFRRKAGDFFISFLCLGLPYLFLDRSHHQRFDAESGVRSVAGPMLVVGAFACLIAAVILSASVTFITLPGIDDVSRLAGFLAILLSASSLIAAVIALFRYKSDIENPIVYPRGEGLVLLSRRSVLLSLPLVFLLYAIAAFITGIALYAFRGLTSSVGGRHFEDFMQWAVIGTVGGLACILLTSQFLIH